jgi:hypothetical protein
MQNFNLTANKIKENVDFWKNNSEDDYVKMIQGIIASDPFQGNKFYIFSFVKRVDDATGVKKMFHQPRLTKPNPIAGSTLMRVDPKDPGSSRIVWTLPQRESFNLYKKGKLFADPFVHECIRTFMRNPEEFLKAEDGDLTDEQIKDVYRTMCQDSKNGT